MDFLGIGTGEILIILVLIMFVFGPQKLPEIARSMGRAAEKMKEASGQFTRQMNDELEDVRKTGLEVSDAVNKEIGFF